MTVNLLLTLAFLFFIGSVGGWVLELFFRRFLSDANPERKWINPGFCTGPYLPLYGSGLCILFLIASLEALHPANNPVLDKVLLFCAMAVSMTVIEYIAGWCSLKLFHVRLWDYSNEWGNVQGIICPKFSLFWALMGAAYYFLVHPHILDALHWLSRNLAFSFFIGMFFGVFLIDVIHSAQLVSKLKAFARDNDVILRYEAVKLQIRKAQEHSAGKYHFFRPFHSDRPLAEHLKEMLSSLESRKNRTHS